MEKSKTITTRKYREHKRDEHVTKEAYNTYITDPTFETHIKKRLEPREMSNLSAEEQKKMVDRITEVMENEFRIRAADIVLFWDMFLTGQKILRPANPSEPNDKDP